MGMGDTYTKTTTATTSEEDNVMVLPGGAICPPVLQHGLVVPHRGHSKGELNFHVQSL
jgi:hypothetical protein